MGCRFGRGAGGGAAGLPRHCLCFPGRVFQENHPQSLRASGEQKFKEGDGLAFAWETTNRAELLVFTDQFQCYKARLSDFDDGKASQLGDYLPTKLSMDPGENVVQTVFPGDYSGFVLFFFESGKVAKVPFVFLRYEIQSPQADGSIFR